ncbi:hypothetical protein DFA_01915 [Cavenderia fasciculata]|uniref:Monalysin Pore-forming domain-containing protein n=1 Tax=Cavenderia fasciculata TaxID=261658 RepID=F4PQR8_CACFS|nr:uncharacterized protein DFA_01915 [Cavenderia fasciculata]EGG22026.1 hypothetical protein DFA_01915 [Cavenderia fasciculata]|eukprot:XP_004359877.1 hypothetical protein DFA_01915 [Cavenderia fasciculata]
MEKKEIGINCTEVDSIIPFNPIPKEISLLEPFDLDNSQMVSTEMGIAQLLKIKNPIDQFVMINAKFDDCLVTDPDYEGSEFNYKPIAVYNRYIGYEILDEPETYPVTYFKGWVPGNSFIGRLIDICDSKNQVTKLYEGGDPFPSNEPAQTSINLGVGPSMIFQTIIIYGKKVTHIEGVIFPYFLDLQIFRGEVFSVPASHVHHEPVPPKAFICKMDNKEIGETLNLDSFKSIPKGIKILDPFDLDNSEMVLTELGVDQLLKIKNPNDQFVMINAKLGDVNSSDPSFPNQNISIKPIAVYNRYIDYVTLESPDKAYPISYFKGFVPGNQFITKIIEFCDKFNQVTKMYSGGDSIPTQEPAQKTIRLRAGTSIIFQTIIVYGMRMKDKGENPNPPSFMHVQLYRDDIFSVPANNVVYEPVNPIDCSEYLTGKGASRWKEI